jgi:hypothetical protein
MVTTLLVLFSLPVFLLRCLMPEFAAAGGEMISHGAAQLQNSPTPELILSNLKND